MISMLNYMSPVTPSCSDFLLIIVSLKAKVLVVVRGEYKDNNISSLSSWNHRGTSIHTPISS